jgi:RND family efflux transporter MFP subunit
MQRLIPFLCALVLGMAAVVAQAEDKPKTPEQGGIEATVQWARRVELGCPVSGRISEISVKIGEPVKKGQVLLKLDGRGFQARVDQYKAMLAGLKETRDEADRELKRSVEGVAQPALSDTELQLARSAAARAQADYQAAKAALAQAQLELEYSQLRAPIDGIVVARRAELGQAVISNNQAIALITIADHARLHARAEVSRALIERFKPGAAHAVMVGGKRFEGKVERLGVEPLDGLAGDDALYELIIEFPAPKDWSARSGQRATLPRP